MLDEKTNANPFIFLRISNAQIPRFEELQKLSQRIVEIGNAIDQRELRWLELSE